MQNAVQLLRQRTERNPIVLVFFFFLLLMLSSNGGHFDVWDGKGYYLVTQNLVKHQSLILQPDLVISKQGQGSFNISSYFSWLHSLRNEGIYLQANATLEPSPGIGSPLFAAIGVPFYIVGDIIGYPTEKLTSYFVNSLVVSLLCTVVFAFGSEFYKSRRIGFVIAIIAGIGSLIWPYVTSYFIQTLAALISISCLYFLYIASRGVFDRQKGINKPYRDNNKIAKFSPVIAGVLLGAQSFGHPGTSIMVPGIAIIGIYIFRKNKYKLLQFLLAVVFSLSIQGLVNVTLHGTVTDFGYGFTQTRSVLSAEGLYSLIISPGLGLITYFPTIAFLPLAVYFVCKQNKVFCIAFLYVFLSILIFYGTLPGVLWTGLGGWGPRYMVPIIPVLALMIGSIISNLWAPRNLYESGYKIDNSSTRIGRPGTVANLEIVISPGILKNILRILFVLLVFSGFIVNLMGVLVWYQAGFAYAWSNIDKIVPQSEGYKYYAWDPTYNPVVLHLLSLATGWINELKNAAPLYYGWEPCVPDNFIYCNFGFFPILAMLVATSLIGIATLYIIYLPPRKLVTSR